MRRYGKYVPLRSAVVFGGVSINPQIALQRRGVDVLVATPGRLLDHASQRNVDLSGVEIFVLDEADRMLDMGFLPDIRRVIALLPAKRQNLLFSATFPDDIRRLAGKLLDDPASIEVARRTRRPIGSSSSCYHVEKSSKRAVLSQLISKGDWHQVLVFTRTKHGANRLAEQLESDGLTAAAIHGNKSQAARTRALADFKAGNVRVLVATDIAARGLDIDQLPHVVNYELPDVPEHYVHRIGRTGRAGREGVAVSLVSGDERPLLKAIERLVGQRIRVAVDAGCNPSAPGCGRHANPGRRSEPRTSRPRWRPATATRQHEPRHGDAGRRDYVNNERHAPYADRGGRAPAPNTGARPSRPTRRPRATGRARVTAAARPAAQQLASRSPP